MGFSSRCLRSVSPAAHGSAYLLTHRSWTRRIGTGLRKCNFSRPRRRLTTRPASSSTRRCFITPKRVIGKRSSSAPRVWPSARNSSSSSARRVGSARARKTSSTRGDYVTDWSHVKPAMAPAGGDEHGAVEIFSTVRPRGAPVIRRPPWLVTAIAASCLVAGGAWATVANSTAHPDDTRSAPAARGSDRFLQLTGDQATADTGHIVAATREASAAAAAKASRNCRTDPKTVGTTPTGWCIRPAGHNVDVLRFPLGLATAQGGQKVVVTSNGGGPQGLTVIDAATLGATPTTQGNLFMGVAPTPDGRIYASGGNADRVFRFHFAGNSLVSEDATEQATFPVHNGAGGALGPVGQDNAPATDGIHVAGYPGPIARYGRYAFLAGTLSEPSDKAHPCPGRQSACGRVTVLDATKDAVVARIPVGLDAIGLAVDSRHKRLYVANWGDEVGRGHGVGGTVSVVDIAASDPAKWHETAYVRVGHHPSAVQLSLNATRLFVANTNDDTMSVVDLTGRRPVVRRTQTLSPASGVPVGAHPDAFALSPNGSTLFVALAGMNAVEVRDGHTGARLAGAPVYIPTGWYPSALTVTRLAGQRYRLWVANAKGTGPGFGPNGAVLFDGVRLGGSVSVVDLPVSAKQQNTWTRQTVANDFLDGAAAPCRSRGDVKVSEVLCPPGHKSSPIKHVVYIVTENKTFDQYFGD